MEHSHGYDWNGVLLMPSARRKKSFAQTAGSIVEEVRIHIARHRVRNRVIKFLRGREFSLISSNCIGGRLYGLAGEMYLSPTVGLWFMPADFIEFVGNLSAYLEKPLQYDAEATLQVGYPVGRLGQLRLFFQHYPSFDFARAKWVQRSKRVNLAKVVAIFTDRDGASEQDAVAFDRLLIKRKIMLCARAYQNVKSAVCVSQFKDEMEVGDLYTDWHILDSVLSTKALSSLFSS